MVKISSSVLEVVVERMLVLGIEARGGIADKIEFVGKRGCPDRLVAMPGGRLWLVETKRPRGGKLSAQQKDVIARYDRAGIRVRVIRTPEQVQQFFGEIDAY